MGTDADPFAGLVGKAIAGAIPGATGIANLKRLSGGANKETWSFDVRCDGAQGKNGLLPLVLRRAPRGVDVGRSNLLSLEREAAVVQAAAGAGLPAPRVRYVLQPDDGLGHGFFMDRIEGETLARRILRDEAFAAARPLLAGQCGAILARLHRLTASAVPGLRVAPILTELGNVRTLYRSYRHPHPVFALAFRWLAERAPAYAQTDLVLVHGDFRHGNLIIGPEGVRAVLDWEGAHIGDPMEDLAWISVNSWRFGNIDQPVGGFGQREDLFAGYEAAGGRTVDRDRVRFWEVYGTLRWGIGCMGMYATFASGADRSVERAAIGRRASETEIDLLALITGKGWA
ncbi:phosphotransferase family protein [Vineibacter terrae]|uniref:phosphotransferase family protein n=1 Tax=Vineibacter terrae TaxID=2586908 RepID=UPI0015B4E1B7|nr:phosphotransferase family protein [Vineibacter terrae]